ncbi:MAG: hypothetical protein HY782_13355 [Chloroflexi bacterium]|nr:hypothetical protein [Chloroflexota bacterium]
MDYGRLITRSFQVMWRYRALWLFGILLALFGGGGANFNVGNYSFGDGDGRGGPGGIAPNLPPNFAELIVVIVAAAICIALILVVLSIIVRLLSRGALVGLVAELETDQTIPTVRRGFRIGADRFKSLLGIALLVNVPLFVVSFALIVIAAVPLIASLIPLIGAAGGRAPDELIRVVIAGAFGSVLIFCCVIILLILVQLVIRPFYEFFVRACVIAQRGAMDSIREGYRLVRANLGNTIVLYILLIGIEIGFGILMIPVGLILIGIPVGIGIAIGIAMNSAVPGIIVGAIIGIPMLLILLFVSGLFRVFESTYWTEGYLAMSAPPATA